MPAWIIQSITMGLALSVQVAGLAFFLGKMKAYQDSNAKLVKQMQDFDRERINALTARVDTVDAFSRDAEKSFSSIDVKLAELSSNTRELPAFRERFIAFEATSLEHLKRVDSENARTLTAIESLQRQVGSLAVHGGGRLVELPATKGGL